MSVDATFAPRYGAGITVTPGTSSATSTIGLGSKTLCLTNLSSSVVAYVKVGPSGISASAADYPIPAGYQVTISKNQDHDTIAYYAASSGSLHILPGEGF